MRQDEINKKYNFIFLGGFAMFGIFIMLIMAGLGKGFQTCENKILNDPSGSWWQGFLSPRYPESMKTTAVDVLLSDNNVELLDINELSPSNAFFPSMYYEMSSQSPETKWYNYIDMKPMKAIRFGRERDASGVQNDVHIVAMPGYFFK
ncbi:MAG: hypothetical protein ABH870_06770 [bacterium]